jgi:formate hydrogenlyase subunit 3/multisubunit Na+/H+ antiporter MnhD subunit
VTVLAWLLPVAVPLVAALVALGPWRIRGWLLSLSALPALVLGVAGPPTADVEFDWVAMGGRLALDGPSRLLLVGTAALWTAGGVFARRRPGPQGGFAPLFLLAMAGNVGLLLAADAVTFYALFSLMTIAGYGLVVHERSAAALRAGRVYIALAVAGEMAIFTGLVLAVSAAGTSELAALGPAIAGSDQRDLTIGLLLAGFGVKAGVVPLHLWLPLAHPAAPVPASAVLSGAMIKAGLVGWLRVLPVGEVALPGWSTFVIAAGLLTAFAGVAIGLTQRDAKVNLAYSSVSQMGIITVLVGTALGEPDAAPLAVAGAATYALHHGFAKASLFLGVGLIRTEADPRRHRLLLAGLSLAAVSLAGLPLTSGALAKYAMKDSIGLLPSGTAGLVTVALAFAAAGTTLLMGRLLLLVRRPVDDGPPAPEQAALLVPWAALLVAVAVAGWVVPGAVLDVSLPTWSAAVLWDGTWPVLVGATLLAAGTGLWRRWGVAVPAIPAGDLVVPVEAAGQAARTAWRRRVTPLAEVVAVRGRALRERAYLAVLPGGEVDRLDVRLTRWRVAGVLFVGLGAVLAVLLTG